MSTSAQQKADEVVSNLLQVYETRNTLLIREPLRKFLVGIFGFGPGPDLSDFGISLSDASVVANKILDGKPNVLAKQWRERFAHGKDPADQVVAETIELMAELSREFALQTLEPDLVRHALEAKTSPITLRAVWKSVEVHALGDDVWTVHDLGHSKMVVPLEGDYLVEFKKVCIDILPRRANRETSHDHQSKSRSQVGIRQGATRAWHAVKHS
jgi:hypothetical protein